MTLPKSKITALISGDAANDLLSCKNDRGNDPFAIIFFDDELLGFGVFLDVNPIVGDLMLTQKLLAAAAIRTPVGAIDGDIRF
jgi:hypothetical protein